MSKDLNRRAILAGAAALPATALPAVAVAVEADPIFAAIEFRREALRLWGALFDRAIELEKALPPERRRTDLQLGGAIIETDDPVWIASQRAIEAAWDKTDMELVLTTVPTTPAGLRALAEYVVTEDSRALEDNWDALEVLLATIAQSGERIAATA